MPTSAQSGEPRVDVVKTADPSPHASVSVRITDQALGISVKAEGRNATEVEVRQEAWRRFNAEKDKRV